MIVRRMGRNFTSVEPAFDARAFNALTFAPTDAFSCDPEELEARYERIEGREFTGRAEGRVQLEVEEVLLQDLAAQLAAADAALEAGELLVMENQPGVDFPRLHERTETIVEAGENRFRFAWWVDPPLRFGVYRPRAG